MCTKAPKLHKNGRFFQDGAAVDESTIAGVNQMTTGNSTFLSHGNAVFICEHCCDVLLAFAFILLFYDRS